MKTIFENKKQLEEFCEDNDISYLGLFGSYARGEEKKKSDIDILVDFNKTKSLFEIADTQIFLEKSTGKPVDLVLKDCVKPELKPYIQKDLITLYEKR
uniref:Polymerase nucleotidyl transferase domain-containing protein n=1 Tax=candidate division CPR3 bacterium TaxID=2268181 RepID=A0A7C4R5I5_UNCC3